MAANTKELPVKDVIYDNNGFNIIVFVFHIVSYHNGGKVPHLSTFFFNLKD